MTNTCTVLLAITALLLFLSMNPKVEKFHYAGNVNAYAIPTL